MANKILIYFLLICILGTCSFVTYKVLKHEEIYNNDPLVYGAKVYDIESCTCDASEDLEITFGKEKVTQKRIQTLSESQGLEDFQIQINFTN